MRISVLLFFVLLANTSDGQQTESVRINEALKTGNAAQVMPLLSSTVDFLLRDFEDMVASDQVAGKLKQFFSSNKPTDFVVKHQGTSKLNDHYYIGDLQTSGGPFRVTYFLKKEGAAFKVNQLRVENFQE